jgi:DNA-binding LytR/AlgR family response regulator
MAEDHYLRVYSSAGEALIRMRLGDALLALEAVEGARTHRSWWVARPAVREVRRVKGRIELVLVNDAVAPVSRTYAAALREAGWL